MTNNELITLQSLPLAIKIAKTKLRIQEFVTRLGVENCYISFSGGKDSTVLLDIARSLYPELKCIFVDTGLEYPEIKQFIKTFDNVMTLRPNKSFKQVLERYGYPVISKEQARYIYDIRNTKSESVRQIRLHGTAKGRFALSKKWRYMLDSDIPISHMCCNVMKKNPIRNLNYKEKHYAITGTLAEESQLRLQKYLRDGCNSFETSHPQSQPLGFWTEQDILHYIHLYKLPIASVYGDVVFSDGKYKTTGVKRTGCVFCLFGIHMEEEPNRMQQLKQTHPKLWSYCIDDLGIGEVLDYMGVSYGKES